MCNPQLRASHFCMFEGYTVQFQLGSLPRNLQSTVAEIVHYVKLPTVWWLINSMNLCQPTCTALHTVTLSSSTSLQSAITAMTCQIKHIPDNWVWNEVDVFPVAFIVADISVGCRQQHRQSRTSLNDGGGNKPPDHLKVSGLQTNHQIKIVAFDYRVGRQSSMSQAPSP